MILKKTRQTQVASPVISEPGDSKRRYTFNVVSLKRAFLNDRFSCLVHFPRHISLFGILGCLGYPETFASVAAVSLCCCSALGLNFRPADSFEGNFISLFFFFF